MTEETIRFGQPTTRLRCNFRIPGLSCLLKDVRREFQLPKAVRVSGSLLRAVLSQYENNMFDKDVDVEEDQWSIDYNYQKTQQRSDCDPDQNLGETLLTRRLTMRAGGQLHPDAPRQTHQAPGADSRASRRCEP